MNASLRFSLRLAAVLAVVATAACSGGSSPSVAPVAAPRATTVPGATAAVNYGAGALVGAKYVKRAKVNSLGLDVLVTMRDVPGLLQYAKNSNDPKNGLFRHWLTPGELADRFGASPSDYAGVVSYLNANGIATKSYTQRQIVRAVGAQANIERALGTEFGIYTKKGQTFVAPIGAIRPPAALHIIGIGNAIGYRIKSRRYLQLRASSSFVEGYSPQQIANAFDYTGAYAAGYKGDGITIGIIGTGPITDGDTRIAGGDVTEYRTLFGVAGTGKVVQDVDTMNVSTGNTAAGAGSEYSTGLATPPPVTNPGNSACQAQGASLGDTSPVYDYTTCNPEDLEAQLDTEQASALAPDATVNFYIAYNPMECFGPCNSANPPSQELGLALSDDETQQAISDNASDVISMSFGEDEIDSQESAPGYFECSPPSTSNGCSAGALGAESASNNFGPVEYASLVSEGIAVFAASGDNGAEECLGGGNPAQSLYDSPCVNYPATDPSVTSIGGVNAPLDDAGRLLGPITGWGEATQIAGNTPGGSGGGCSLYFSEPSYASSITSVTSLCSGGFRTQPDVALDADTNTGVAVVADAAPSLGGRLVAAIGGTSVATPEMAAMWALVLQACKQSSVCSSHGSGSTPYRLGNPGTYLYAIYNSQAQYPATFYDVLFGNNSTPNSNGNGQDPGFNAGTGDDLVTGIGVPYAHSLITNVLANVP
jgi:subtilase family serine protease